MSDEGITIVYDGECPFCASYVRLVRLRKALGSVKLVNARERTPEAVVLWKEGYDLDQGMALLYAGKIFYGAECLTQLALMSTKSGLFNRFNARLLSHPTVAKSAYPLLKAGRAVALWILGRGRLLRTENLT
jgi:predicted DCC family thiol-disulfide oxidoreductase YuxK